MNILSTNIFPRNINPYYIVSPPYTRFSAGIKCLHLLCHSLNLYNIPSYIIPYGAEELKWRNDICDPELLTPLLTQYSARKHFEDGKKPIIVYPDIVSGNPFGGTCVVRFLLNFPGELTGDTHLSSQVLCFSYSKNIAAKTPNPDNILFIPVSDTRLFFPPETDIERSGSCFYASKYQKVFKGRLFDITKDSIEITSGMPSSPTQRELADLFRKCEVFYTYENTSLVLEAGLCGCPTVMLPNEYFTQTISSEEFGSDGIAWGASAEQINYAKKSVKNVGRRYEENISRYLDNLNLFIDKTQDYAINSNYDLESYMSLLAFIPPRGDVRAAGGAPYFTEFNYAPKLGLLPPWVEGHIGKFLCSIGLKNDGEFLYNRAEHRRNENKN